MKRTRIPVLIALILPLTSIAQDATPTQGKMDLKQHLNSMEGKNKGYISLGIGVAVPVGKFASNTDDDGGMAITGFTYDISFAYNLNRTIGIAATLAGQKNGMDEEYFRSMLKATLPPSFTYEVNSDAWSTNFFLGGLHFSFPVSPQTNFYIRTLAGLAVGESVATKISLTWAGSTDWSARAAGNGSGFAYLAGAGFKINLNASLCLLVHTDYVGTTITYDDVEYTDSMGGYEMSTIEQQIASFNLGVGLGIRL